MRKDGKKLGKIIICSILLSGMLLIGTNFCHGITVAANSFRVVESEPVKIGKYYYVKQEGNVEGYLTYILRNEYKAGNYEEIGFCYDNVSDMLTNGKKVYYIKSSFVTYGKYKYFLCRRDIQSNKEVLVKSLGELSDENTGKFIKRYKNYWIFDMSTENGNVLYRLDVKKGKVKRIINNFSYKYSHKNYLIGVDYKVGDIGPKQIISINILTGRKRVLSKKTIAYFKKKKIKF